MHIVITHPSMNAAGGIERVLSTMINYWHAHTSWKITIVIEGSDNQSFFAIPESINIVGLNIDTDRFKFYNFKIIKEIKKAYRVCLSCLKPDIIITTLHGLESRFITTINPINCPVVGVNHITLAFRKGLYRTGFLSKIKQSLGYNLFFLRTIKRLSAAIALSKTDYYKLKKYNYQTFFIPNPLDSNVKYDPYEKKNKWVISVGRVDYLKGQDRLINIWRKICHNFPEWKLIIVGKGALSEQLKETIKEFGIENSISIIDSSKNIQKLLNQSEIFALTSRSESFGMVILEALSARLPVITYDCENGPRDIINNGVNGFLIKDNNEEDFCNKLEHLMKDKELRDYFIDQSQETICQYSVDLIMNEWSELIKSLVKGETYE